MFTYLPIQFIVQALILAHIIFNSHQPYQTGLHIYTVPISPLIIIHISDGGQRLTCRTTYFCSYRLFICLCILFFKLLSLWVYLYIHTWIYVCICIGEKLFGIIDGYKNRDINWNKSLPRLMNWTTRQANTNFRGSKKWDLFSFMFSYFLCHQKLSPPFLLSHCWWASGLDAHLEGHCCSTMKSEAHWNHRSLALFAAHLWWSCAH